MIRRGDRGYLCGIAVGLAVSKGISGVPIFVSQWGCWWQGCVHLWKPTKLHNYDSCTFLYEGNTWIKSLFKEITRSIHVAANGKILIFFMAEYNYDMDMTLYVNHTSRTHLSDLRTHAVIRASAFHFFNKPNVRETLEGSHHKPKQI